MYIKMKKAFEDEFENPEQEDKIKKLENIRQNRVTPIDHVEIK